MRNLYLISFLFLLVPCVARGQTFTVYDNFSDLEERLNRVDDNTTLVINFWATWCKPCVEELPFFDQLFLKHADSNFQVILVSLDFKSRIKKTFIPFLEKHPLQPELALLADQNGDSWIPKIHPSWQGTIPATVVIRGDDRALYAEEFSSYEELENFVMDFVLKVQKGISMGSKGTR